MSHTIYFATWAEFTKLREGLKQRMCPHCRLVGRLNRHSLIHGEDGSILGQRVFCNGRYGGEGCCGSFRLLRCDCLAGFRVPLAVLWRYLRGLISGRRRIEAFRESGCVLHESAAYRLFRLLEAKLLHLRSLLFQKMPVAHPPTREGILVQTLVHLSGLSCEAMSPLAAYQHTFQESFL